MLQHRRVTEKARVLQIRQIPILPLGTERETCAIICHLVHGPSLVILHGILKRGDKHNEHDGERSDSNIHSGKQRKRLQNDQHQKESIGDSSELFKQILGDEGEKGILGCPDFIIRILLLWDVQLLVSISAVQLIRRQWDIHSDHTRTSEKDIRRMHRASVGLVVLEYYPLCITY